MVLDGAAARCTGHSAQRAMTTAFGIVSRRRSSKAATAISPAKPASGKRWRLSDMGRANGSLGSEWRILARG